jgi:hypothetical protein
VGSGAQPLFLDARENALVRNVGALVRGGLSRVGDETRSGLADSAKRFGMERVCRTAWVSAAGHQATPVGVSGARPRSWFSYDREEGGGELGPASCKPESCADT